MFVNVIANTQPFMASSIWLENRHFCKSKRPKFCCKIYLKMYCRIFWASMIIISIVCTLWLIASLIDRISKNPIVFYRDDAPIDVTKVKYITNNLNQTILIFKQIPFPAFTFCDIKAENLTTPNQPLDFNWLEQYGLTLSVYEMSLEIGKCKTVNFCDRKHFFQSTVDQNRITEYIERYRKKPKNETAPYKTTSTELGFRAQILSYNMLKAANPFILLVHSPFELPTKDNVKFTMVDMDYDNFFVTPQLENIDDSKINMEPHE